MKYQPPSQELKQALQQHRYWLQDPASGSRFVAERFGGRLSGVDLSFAYLEKADLREACLYESMLANANFHYADLQNADLRHTYLYRADLTGADCTGSEFDRVYMRDCDAKDANFTSASICAADLTKTRLYRANLNMTDLSRSCLRDTHLNGVDLSNTMLHEVVGNKRQIQSLQLRWNVVFAAGIIHIGCQRHSHYDWESFDDAKIGTFHREAVSWWHYHREIILSLSRYHQNLCTLGFV